MSLTLAMSDPASQKRSYKTLSIVFTVAGFVWIIYGLIPPWTHFILFPVVGLINWGIAWYCRQMSQGA
jgi:hypothetical protein